MASAAMSTVRGAVGSVTNKAGYKAGQRLGEEVFDRAEETIHEDIAPDVDADDRFEVVDEEGHVVEMTTREKFKEEGLSVAEIMQTVRVIGGGMIGLAVLVVVLNQVFTLDSISSGSGPFQGVVDSLENTGVAALGLLVIGFLVLAANRVMGFFGSGGF